MRYYNDLSSAARQAFDLLADLIPLGGLEELLEITKDDPPPPPPRPRRILLRPPAPIAPWLDLVEEAIDWCDEVPERGKEFADSVLMKLESLQDWLKDGQPLTELQEAMVVNIREGLKKWVEG